MNLSRATICCVAFIGASAAWAEQPTFSFSVNDFQKRLNAAIQDDSTASPKDGANIKRCRPTKRDEVVCAFRDETFKGSVAAMKKLDLLNGRFEHKLTLTLQTSGGKVSSIRLNGDRGDPANLFSFYGTAIDVVRVFDAKAVDTDDKLKELSERMGLMRGDDADDVGKFRVVIEPYAEMKCLAVPSSVSTGHVCVWLPRS